MRFLVGFLVGVIVCRDEAAHSPSPELVIVRQKPKTMGPAQPRRRKPKS